MALVLDNVTICPVATPEQPLIGPVSLTIRCGEIFSVMGPSGCGKSSLLSCIAGALSEAFQAKGRITLGDKAIEQLPIEQRHVGILFQDPLLFPHFSVLENLIFATPGRDRKLKRQQALEALESVGLGELAGRHISQLSGGQQARIALLRTLQARPQALLLDEPFSKLDSETRRQFRTQVYETIAERQIPALLVTHDESDIADPAQVLRLG